jgi:hypothetical protein
MSEEAKTEASRIRANPALQFGSLVLAALGVLAVVVPAVGLTLAVASLLLATVVPPKRGVVRVVSIVLIGVALIANVVALILVMQTTDIAPEIVIQPN